MRRFELKPESAHEKRTGAFVAVVGSMALVIAVLAIVRIVFAFKFATPDVFADNSGAIPLFLLNALRFDAQVGAYVAMPVLLVAIIVAVPPTTFFRGGMRFVGGWLAFAVTVVGLVDMADIHWYTNFARHFDIVAFDFFDEEPGVLIKGIISEAPVVPMLLGGAAVFLVAWFAGHWMLRTSLRLSRHLNFWVAAVGSAVILAVAARGSLGTFTLRAEDVYVSTSGTMNDCVPNGIFMLKKAWSEKKKQFKMTSDQDILTADGFTTESEAAATFLGIPDDGHLTADSAIIALSPEAPIREGYDVVLIVCESWGRKLMDYEARYGIDLLCSMRQHLQSDPLFLNFLSATNGTIDAVESFTTACPYPRLFTSRYRDTELPFSAARVFANAGYSTHFVSGIEISWRNLFEVLPHHGFDSVTGKFEMLQEMPDAELNKTWGVFDHSMLTYLLQQIEQPAADGKPRFFMALTSTNHTPFEFPSGYELPDIEVPSDPAAFAIDDQQVILDYLRGYQYTSRALGDFMTALKSSPAGRRTIVAITGDHNTRLILPYPDGEDLMFKYSVPLYLYVPDAPAEWKAYAVTRFGSHQDIVPTLIDLTLPGAPHLATGQDLLADSIPAGTYGVNVAHEIFSPDADTTRLQAKLRAADALKKIWFKRQFEK